MMPKHSLFVASTALVLFASGCQQQAEEASAPPIDVRLAMQTEVNPAMLAIWDVGNNALDDNGGIDPAKMDAAKWESIATEAAKLAAAGKALAAGDSFIAAATDNSETAEGEVTMAQVQAHIDANPAGLRQEATSFAAHADKLVAAAKAQDAATAGALISEMDAVCESCHTKFWDTGQP